MSDLTPAQQLKEKIHLWKTVVDVLAENKAMEMELRKEIMAEAFPDAKLGTNTFDLGAGFKLKGTLKESVKIDAAALTSIKEEFPEGMLDMVIKYDPKLINKGYKTLPDKLRKKLDGALIIKPASPALEVVAPKAKK